MSSTLTCSKSVKSLLGCHLIVFPVKGVRKTFLNRIAHQTINYCRKTFVSIGSNIIISCRHNKLRTAFRAERNFFQIMNPSKSIVNSLLDSLIILFVRSNCLNSHSRNVGICRFIKSPASVRVLTAAYFVNQFVTNGIRRIVIT